jgi:hypothetical protein
VAGLRAGPAAVGAAGGEGLRLGEALGLQHRDWHTGCGDTAFIEVVPRDHRHGVRVKGGRYRKLYVSAGLDRLYGEYVWQLCEAGADLAGDLDEACVFVNLAREPRLAPWRPESVYDLVGRLRAQLARQVPADWDAALVQAQSRHGLAAGRGAGARGQPPARPRRRADHAEHLRQPSGIASDGREPAGRLVSAGAEWVQVLGDTCLLTWVGLAMLPFDA